MEQKYPSRSGGLTGFFLLFLTCFFVLQGAPARADADFYCDPQIRQVMTNDAQAKALDAEKKMNASFKGVNSFDSKYCTAQILSNFNQIGTTLGGAFYALIKNLLDAILRQACQAIVSPLQNAASKLCIPFFSLPNFNLNLAMNNGMCSGTPLLSVRPVYNSPVGTSSYTTPTSLP